MKNKTDIMVDRDRKLRHHSLREGPVQAPQCRQRQRILILRISTRCLAVIIEAEVIKILDFLSYEKKIATHHAPVNDELEIP